MFGIAHQVMTTDEKGGLVGQVAEVTERLVYKTLQDVGEVIYIFCHVGSQTAHP